MEEKKIAILKNKSEMLKIIAHPARLCILDCLITNGECNVSKLVAKMELPQSTISQHLSKLKACGLVEGVRNGTEVQYKLIDDDVKLIIDVLLRELH